MPFHLSSARAVTRRSKHLGLLLAASLVAGAACRDPLRNEAQAEVLSAALAAVALTGTAPNAPSALILRGTPSVVTPEGTAGSDFDLAVDLDAGGRAVLYPAQLVTRSATRRVAIRRANGTYDALTRAPGGSYLADSAVALAAGAAVAVRVPVPEACQFTASPYFYSKLVVDSVRLADRTIFLRATTNPNCGFRSFAPGIPRD